jgi:hypothetical protein
MAERLRTSQGRSSRLKRLFGEKGWLRKREATGEATSRPLRGSQHVRRGRRHAGALSTLSSGRGFDGTASTCAFLAVLGARKVRQHARRSGRRGMILTAIRIVADLVDYGRRGLLTVGPLRIFR